MLLVVTAAHTLIHNMHGHFKEKYMYIYPHFPLNILRILQNVLRIFLTEIAWRQSQQFSQMAHADIL